MSRMDRETMKAQALDSPGFSLAADFLKSARRKPWRWLIPVILVLLFLFVIIWLPWQAQKMEATERQEQLIADTLWVEQSIRFEMRRNEEMVRSTGNDIEDGKLTPAIFHRRLQPIVSSNRVLLSLDWLDAHDRIIASAGTNHGIDLIGSSATVLLSARKRKSAEYAPPVSGNTPHISYFQPLFASGRYIGTLAVSYSPSGMLNELIPWWVARDNEIEIFDADDVKLASRASGGPGKNVYTHQRELDLPGTGLIIRTNSVKGPPRLLPGLLVGSVILLVLGLFWSLGALWRDINRRLATEGELRNEVAFKTAMENSLVTGLRTRDLEGRTTYVNPAFCKMVGLPASELVGRPPPMRYWAPEALDEYQARMNELLAGTMTPEGFHTVFQRSNGERFPVLIYESPLVDASGKQTGWMSSILDISDIQRVEELNRQQQEKLQASSRLAAMGEIASTLAHELNQPLAAVSSYLTGALNMIEEDKTIASDKFKENVRPAIEKAAAQTQRAGHIIRSVHSFTKRRETNKVEIDLKEMIDRVTPLIELQAQRKFVTVQKAIPENLPNVVADATLMEQVLLNLTRNAIDAMEGVPAEKRILRIEAYTDEGDSGKKVIVAVIDRGCGISKEVESKLFSPFFSTKADGMGMGLNICRTAVEAHGGTLGFAPNPDGGTIFSFSLPAD